MDEGESRRGVRGVVEGAARQQELHAHGWKGGNWVYTDPESGDQNPGLIAFLVRSHTR
jgi:hypothetical protein